MKLSTVIEEFIKDMINDADGTAELQRNELALRFNCVPSQINYVISTRFSPENGYIVESRRGGGGYIKITRAVPDDGNYILRAIDLIGDYISASDSGAIIKHLFDRKLISEREGKMALAAVSDKSIPIGQPSRDLIRAKMLKNILINIL